MPIAKIIEEFGVSFHRTSQLLTLAACGFCFASCHREPSPPASQVEATAGHPVMLSVPSLDHAPGLQTATTAATLAAPSQPELDPRAAQLFDTLLNPGITGDEWEKAHQELLALDHAAVHLLVQKLGSGTDQERELASTTLALLGNQAEEAAPALLKALEDQSEFVRANAAAALVQIPEHTSRAVPILVNLLEASDPQLRQMAAMNLNAVGDEARPLVDQLARALQPENPPEVIVPVVELLGRIGPSAQSALPGLQKIAFERPGQVGDAATTAIHLITGESKAP